MKHILFLWCGLLAANLSHAQGRLTGTVSDGTGNPLAGASVRYLSTGRMAATGADGSFFLPLPLRADTLLISFVGYLSQRLPVAAAESGPLQIALEADPNALDEVVVSTGYYQIPKERATGSFEHVDNALFNRSVSTNILQRLEGVVPGVQFVEPQAGDASGIRVRGLSTIEADTRPLIVVDNFPYEGDINTINPNDVESITVLKDAAAASIWGARAGNGVIVINTKQGAYNQPAWISVNSNVTVGERPDLFYSQNYLPSATVMEIQQELFERGTYSEANQTYIPSYVELLIKQRDGLISDGEFARQEAFMQQTDLRRDVMEYLYQPPVNQQYSLGVRGGGDSYHYALSAGYDRNRSHVTGNDSERLNLSLQNTFRVRPNLELTGTVWYTQQRAANNGITHGDLGLFGTMGNRSFIYDALVDAEGNPGITFSQYRQAYREQAESLGLLDWMYRPLDEQRILDNTNGSKELRLNAGVRYSFLQSFNLDASYQYTNGDGWGRQYHTPESYYVRNLVNRFTQADGSTPIPHGGILELGAPPAHQTHSGRAMLNFDRDFGADHRVAVLLGGEVRQRILETLPAARYYAYDPALGTGRADLDYRTSYPVRPQFTARIPPTTTVGVLAPSQLTDRFLSYFGNASYTVKNRYILSGSARWDGSNLLGVKTNQRGTALWSVGGSWDITKEPFYRMKWLPYLRLRTTYGSAGNIDKSQSHYPTIYIGTDPATGLPQSSLDHPGNPSLRWEQVNTFNAGVDWRLSGNRINGSVEYYNKHARHLLGDNLMDPTTGVGGNYKMNYAGLRTQGWDVTVESRNLTGEFGWSTMLLLSTTNNRITSYNAPLPPSASYYLSSQIREAGESADIVYSFPWHGLSPENGMPIIFVDGQPSTDPAQYASYYLNFPPEELIRAGNSVPTAFGSIRNVFSWKNIEIGALFSWKAGYVFRRSSIGPGQEYLASPFYHTDYFDRWQNPGDESRTDVPAWAETAAPNQRWGVYRDSEALITNGAHIRLQDISASYSLPKTLLPRMPVSTLRLYAYARNLGILWKANDNGIDPDYVNADYVAPKTFALGLQIEF
ncbi:SusC/RagA family TonB-linked outer membrane protein [Parapedobacter koreensis]|uniref:TonB-linked outer membrane protein, SusC/RagA family n=1 Tax=Parapedobacter koreensis TaxID=332977 RepID=A0A1H7GTG9_9SPHI|nr:SusC/RagA family TonB-linked outer membrane protein [Parapedobacter koreensis]SEK41319.1 TonB-linked outer membrane protein, SusC/RagA family [Parapedobacter koreensis]